MSANRNRYPFTARQWHELQQQALVFKYMASGMPVPPNLLFSITTPFHSSTLFSHPHPQQHYGWKCYGAGLGKKVDPEPGRCRRTDGKKWRCSKEAYSDSKYCERHMHRGKTRSRKPVEFHHPPSSISISTKNLSFSSPSSLHQQPLFYSPRPSHDTSTSTNLLLYSDYSSSTNSYGLKEQVDEHPFFSSEPSAAGTPSGFSASDAWQLTPLTVSSSSSSSSKQSSCSALDTDYSYLQLHSRQYAHSHDQSKEAKQDQHCYVLDSHQEQPQKTVHRFFDEWPLKNRDSWLDLEDKSSTRLSISIPTSSQNCWL